jgi:hypothetical protein
VLRLQQKLFVWPQQQRFYGCGRGSDAMQRTFSGQPPS